MEAAIGCENPTNAPSFNKYPKNDNRMRSRDPTDPVPPGLLGLIHRLIGTLQQRFLTIPVSIVANADTDRYEKVRRCVTHGRDS